MKVGDLDPRDLVINEATRDYWKKNFMMLNFESKLGIIMRAYAPIEEKRKYLEYLKLEYPNLIGYINYAKEYLDMNVLEFYDYSDYVSVYQLTAPEDPNDMKFDNIWETSNHKILNGFSYGNYNDLYNNIKDCVDIMEDDYDYIVNQYVIDKYKIEDIKVYSHFYIKGRKLSLIIDNSEELFTRKYIYTSDAYYDYEHSLYPFEHNQYVTVEYNQDCNICGYFIDHNEESSGRHYTYLAPEKAKDKEDIPDGSVDISYLRFQSYYNLYDWMKTCEEKEDKK